MTNFQSQRDREKAAVRNLASIADRCRHDAWTVDNDDCGTHVLTKRENGERAILCTIYKDASADEVEIISGALETLIFLLTLRKRSIVAFSELEARLGSQSRTLKPGNFTATASIYISEQPFHRFLERRDTGGAIHNKELADAALKRVLGITSKKQINTDVRAQAAFLQLRDDYEEWKKRVGE